MGKIIKNGIEYSNSSINTVENARKVNGYTVNADVPVNAQFTDTVYNDTEVRGLISDNTTNINNLTTTAGTLNNKINNLTTTTTNLNNIVTNLNTHTIVRTPPGSAYDQTYTTASWGRGTCTETYTVPSDGIWYVKITYYSQATSTEQTRVQACTDNLGTIAYFTWPGTSGTMSTAEVSTITSLAKNDVIYPYVYCATAGRIVKYRVYAIKIG